MPAGFDLSERMRPVHSRQNAHVRDLRRAFATGAPLPNGLVAVEGPRLVVEALRSGAHVHTLFVRAGSEQTAAPLLPQLGAKAEVLLLSADAFDGAAPTETPQGIAALVSTRVWGWDALLSASAPLLVVLHALQDPGNLGTILRSAEAFGAHGLVLTPGTVAPWNPKVVRASAGSVFRVPVVRAGDVREVLDTLHARGLRLLGTSSHRGVPPSECRLAEPSALFVGNEGAGLPKDLLARMDERIAIPHVRPVESLNAGIAASILLYEAARQRGAGV